MEVQERLFSKRLLILGSLTAFGPLSIDMYLPAFPKIAEGFQVPISSVELSLTAYFVGLALGQVCYGPIVDRFGRKPAIYFGVSLYAAISILCALVQRVEFLIIARFFQALGACGGVVASRAIVRDLYNEKDSARVFSMLMLIMGLAPILAPLLGGWIASNFGWRAMFYVLAAWGVLCLWGVHSHLHETRGADPNVKIRKSFRIYASILKNKKFLGFTLAAGCIQSGMFAYITGSPFVLIEYFKVPAESYGLYFGTNALGLIALSQLNAQLLKRFTSKEILSYAIPGVAAVGILLLAVTLLNFDRLAFLIPLFLFVSTLGIVFPNSSALALAGEGSRAGSASALMGTIQFTCSVISSSAVSFFDNGTPIPMTATMAVCAVSSLLVFRWAARS